MEARLIRVAPAIRVALVAAVLMVSMGARHRTPNFLVETSNPQLAARFAQAAETYRRELAISWLGEEMPQWSEPCVVTIHVGRNLGAGGQTEFVFHQGEVYGWRMIIQGSAERVLDSVLPHEITHMIFACHFRRPLPRWADEGGATSVECAMERQKHHKMLVRFLTTRRGIAFNDMFVMTEYPRDVMPLYAQGFSLAEFLIRQGGRPKFLAYVGEGTETGRWGEATKRHYGYENLGVLQNTWVGWVGQGFPPIRPSQPGPAASPPTEMLAAGERRPRPEPNLLYRTRDNRGAPGGTGGVVPAGWPPQRPAPTFPAGAAREDLAAAGAVPPDVLPKSGWRPAGSRGGQPPVTMAGDIRGGTTAGGPIRAQVTHPQPVGQVGQTILRRPEW